MAIPTIEEKAKRNLESWVKGVREVSPNVAIEENKISFASIYALMTAISERPFYLLCVEGTRQTNPLTADSKTVNPDFGTLEIFGQIILGREPFIAEAGRYRIKITGVEGASVPALTPLTNNNTGIDYITQQVATIDVSGADTVEVVSGTNGEAGRAFVGDELTFLATFSGIDGTATVEQETKEPVDAEGIEDYRQKILDKERTVPRGGSVGDIINYGLEVDGVKAIYSYNGVILGDTRIYVRATTPPALDNEGTPPQSIIDSVKTSINTQGNFSSPNNIYLPIIRRAYIVEVVNLSSTSIENDVQNVVNEYFQEKEPFIDGFDMEEDRIKEEISRSKLFSRILEIIPETEDLEAINLKVEESIERGFFKTPNISANLDSLYGSNSAIDSSFNFVRDGGVELNVQYNGQSITSLNDYILLLSQLMRPNSVNVRLEEIGTEKIIVFESYTRGTASSIELKTPTLGTDITGSGFLDIANGEKETGGTVKERALFNDILPDGNVPYAKDIIFTNS